MYKEILNEQTQSVADLVANMQLQLDAYKKKPAPSQNFIFVKEREIFTLRQFLQTQSAALADLESARIEHGDRKYLAGLKQGNNEQDAARFLFPVTKNTIHAGTMIKALVEALKPADYGR
jgi:hypothetical protein